MITYIGSIVAGQAISLFGLKNDDKALSEIGLDVMIAANLLFILFTINQDDNVPIINNDIEENVPIVGADIEIQNLHNYHF